MEQNYIDKLFKDKLENREVAFSEDAWFAAEQLIQKEEQRRKWGGLGRLFYILPFLIAGMLLYVHNTSSLAIPATQNGMISIPISPTNQSDLEVESLSAPKTIATEEDIHENKDTKATGSEDKLKESVVSSISPVEEHEYNISNTVSTENINKPNLKVDKLTIKQIVNPITPPSNSLKQLRNGTPKMIERPQAVQLLKEQELEEIIAPIGPIGSIAPNAPITTESDLEAQDEKLAIATSKAYAALELTPVDFTFETSPPVLKKENLINYKPRKFHVGLMTAAILTPSFNDQVIGVSGLNVGGTFAWLFNLKWSLNADLLYEFHGRNYAFPNGNNSLSVNYQTYSFGVNDNFLNVKVKQSHLITLPLYFKYKIDRHSISLGAQMTYTMGLRGEIEEEVVAPVESASIRVDKDSWLDSDKVSPFQFNIMTGYQFALTKQLSVGLRTVIVPSRLPRHGNGDENAFNALELLGIGGEKVEGEKTPIPLFEHNAINFHVNVQYTLNAKRKHIAKPLLEL